MAFVYQGQPFSLESANGIQLLGLYNSGNKSERNNRLYLGNSKAKPIFRVIIPDVTPGDAIWAEGNGEATTERNDWTAIGEWLEIRYTDDTGAVKTIHISERKGENVSKAIHHHVLHAAGWGQIPDNAAQGPIELRWMWVANASTTGGNIDPHYIFTGGGDVTPTTDRKDYGRLIAQKYRPL